MLKTRFKEHLRIVFNRAIDLLSGTHLVGVCKMLEKEWIAPLEYNQTSSTSTSRPECVIAFL